MLKALAKLLLVLLLIAAGLAAYGLYLPIGPTGEKFILIPPGSSPRRIARELKKEGLIRSEWAFLGLHAWKLKSLKAGEYRFDRSANAFDVYDRLARGDIFFHVVTIPEGYNIFEVANVVAGSGLATRDEFLAAARDVTLIADLDPAAKSLEGYLFPDTYQLTRTQTPRDMAQVMVRRFRETAQQLGLASDYHRLVTLASIIEKETSVPEERALVASVYYNRLAKRAALAADPTVVYAAMLAGKWDGIIHRSDLDFDSPYNTYKYAGLPPGPIANPGRASLEAALRPAQTEYFFFVSDANGRHRFARTSAEHERNVAAYRRALGR